MTTTRIPDNYWTIAIRPVANCGIFHRVDLSLTWRQAEDLARYVHAIMPEAAVWYVPNAEYDARYPSLDSNNVMVDTGNRIRIKDDGVLPFDTTPPTAATLATTIVNVEAGGWAGWRLITFADGRQQSVTQNALVRTVDYGRWTMTPQAIAAARAVAGVLTPV